MAGIEWVATLDNSSFINSMRQIQESVTKTQSMVESLREQFGRVSPFAKMEGSDKVLQSFDEQVKRFSGNLDGYFSGVRERLYDMLATVDKAREELDGVTEKKSNKADISEARELIDSLQTSIEEQISFIEGEQRAYKALSESIETSTAARQSASEATSVETESISQSTEAVQEQAKAQKELAGAVDEVSEAVKEQSDAFEESKPFFTVNKGDSSNYTEELQAEIDEIVNKISEGNQKILNAVDTEAYEAAKRELEELAAKLEEKRATLTRALYGISEDFEPRGTSAPLQVVERIDELGKSITVAASSVEEGEKVISEAFKKMEMLEAAREGLGDEIDRLNASDEKNSITTRIDELMERLQDVKSTADLINENGLIDVDKVNAIDELGQISDKIAEVCESQAKAKEEAEQTVQVYKSIRTRIMEARQEIFNLVEAGKQNTDEFEEAVKKAAELEKEMQKVNLAIEYGKKGGTLAALKDGLQGIAGVGSLAVGVLGLFNKNSEEMVAIQTKIQSLIGIIVGLQQSYTFSTKAATIATKLFNFAFKSGPWGWAVTAITAVVGAISAYIGIKNRSKELEEKANAETKKSAAEWKRLEASVHESASTQLADYKKLQVEWNNLKTTQEKNEFLEENKSKFDAMGFAIDNVDELEMLFVSNTAAVVQALKARAEAEAWGEIYRDKLKEKLNRDLNPTRSNNRVYTRVHAGDTISDEEARALGIQNRTITNTRGGNTGSYSSSTRKPLTEDEATRVNAYRNAQAVKAVKKETEELTKIEGHWTDSMKAASEAQSKLNTALTTSNKTKKGGKKTTKETKDVIEEEQKLARQRRDNQLLQEQALIDQMEEGVDKEIRQMQLNHIRRMAEIDDEQQELQNAKRKSTKNKNAALTDEELIGINAKRVSENEAYAKEMVAVFNKIEGSTETAQEKIARLNTAYAKFVENVNGMAAKMNIPSVIPEGELQRIQQVEKEYLEKMGKGGIMDELRSQFGNGNVDVLARPIINAAELVKKGWKDAGEGIATVFSSQIGIKNAAGKETEILVTPILPDGSVLSPKELEDYVHTQLEGANDILKADTKGIVIAVDVPIPENELDDVGYKLHELHEQLFDEEVTPYIQNLYATADREYEAFKNVTATVNKEIAKSLERVREEETQAMIQYLREYGTAEERRLAIVQEYEQKIKEARTEGERLALQGSMERELQSFDSEQLRKAFDFEDIFNNLGDMAVDRLEDVRRQLRSMLSETNLSMEDYKTIAEQIDAVNEAIIERRQEDNRFLGFIIPSETKIKKLKEEQAEAMKQQAEAQAALSMASLGLSQAQNNISNVFANNGASLDIDIKSANADRILEEAAKAFGKDSDLYKNVKSGLDSLGAAERKAANTQEKKNAADNKVTSVTERLKVALGDLRERVGNFADQLDQINANIQSLPDLVDTLGLGNTGVGEGVKNFADGVNSGIGAMKDFASGNYVGAAVNAFKSVQSFGRVLGIGGGNAATVMKSIDKLTERNGLLQESIDNLNGTIEKGGVQAVNAYNQSLDYQKEVQKNYQEILRLQGSYHDAHHSFDYYWSGFSQQQINKVNQQLGGGSWNGDIYNLSPEEAKAILSNVDMVEQIKNTGKGGYGERFLEILRQYAELAGQIEESTEALYDGLSQVSFDSLRDSFMSSLLDMDKKAEDFADDFSDYMRKAMLNAMMTETLDEELKNWRDKFAEFMKGDNALDEKERSELFADWQRITQRGIEIRDAINEAVGETVRYPDQEANRISTDKISYEQADMGIGILTAIQIAQEQGNEVRANILAYIGDVKQVLTEGKFLDSELRNLAEIRNEYLLDIKKSNQKILDGMNTKMEEVINVLEEIK